MLERCARSPEDRPDILARGLSSREQVEAVAARLSLGLSELASDVRGAIEATVPALRDQETTRLLEASVEENIEAMLGMLALGIDPAGVDPPSVAFAHARRLAQRGVSTFALTRAYRVAMARFLRRLIEDLVSHGEGVDVATGRATLEMVDRVTTYVDRVIESLITAYAHAHDEWLDPNAILRERVRSVVRERDLNPEAAQARLGSYRVEQHHIGLELWVNPAAQGVTQTVLRNVAAALCQAVECSETLFVPVDEASACLWLGLGTRDVVERERLECVLAGYPAVYASIGEPGASLAGFRRTHQQALTAETVALVRDPPREHLTPYANVAAIASMCSDLDAACAWVAETLGALAIDDDYHARFRETAEVFFANDGSYVATAAQLHLHRNSAMYRVQRAEEMRGRPFRDGRLDVALALLACHWFGAVVLQSPISEGVRLSQPAGKR